MDLLPNFSKMFLGHTSCDSSGPDLQNDLPFKTRQKSDKSPLVLDLLPTFSKMLPGHISRDRFGGLPCKMTSLSRPAKNQISPPQVFNLLPALSQMFIGHISCDRFRGLPYRMTSLSGPDKNQISPPGCWTCSSLFPKCSLGTFLVTGFWT